VQPSNEEIFQRIQESMAPMMGKHFG